MSPTQQERILDWMDKCGGCMSIAMVARRLERSHEHARTLLNHMVASGRLVHSKRNGAQAYKLAADKRTISMLTESGLSWLRELEQSGAIPVRWGRLL